MVSYPNDLVPEFAFQLDEFYLDLQEDGSKISILEKEKIEARPFPGLRPFKTSEFQLFKGRDGQSEELLKRLKKNHFLAVIGSSGTGKSSLVRAGLIPQLFGGYLQSAGNKWNIAICRPGKDPVENLAVALSSIKGHSKDKSHIYENYQSIGPQLNTSIYGILEVNELLNAGLTKEQEPNLLIIIDQFEELFRFDRKDLGKKNIENHFVNLLLKASLNPSSSVYVIITMRSEFLGDCVKYRGLPEAINEGQYLVPQLTRNQVKEVIEGPINLAGKKITPGLVELLINEIEESKVKENLDQLPILQHALMRTYQEAMLHGSNTVISYEHYKEIGEMEKALANHAEAKFKELGQGSDDNHLSKKQQIVKIIFQALTDASTDQKGGRRPTELKNIYAISKSAGASEKEVDEVVNHFRDVDTSFIMPPINPDLPNTGLYPDLMMDISHESLMRNWERLNKWISEEVRFGKLYKTLNERRELNEQDNSELVRGFLLRELIDWKAKYLNNFTWAIRYQHLPKDSSNNILLHENLFKKNLAFLEKSEAATVAAKEAEKSALKKEIQIEQREKSRKKQKIFFISLAVISVCFGLWAFNLSNNAKISAAEARQQEQLAEFEKGKALKSEKEARDIGKYATDQKDSALKFASELQKQTDLAKASVKEAQKQKLIADRLRKQAVAQGENSEKQLVKSEVQKERFYSSNYLSFDSKEPIVKALFLGSMPDLREIPMSKYIDTELLQDVNNAVEAREIVLYKPTQGLRMADTVWRHIKITHSTHNKNDIIENILLDIFKTNVFPTTDIKPGPFSPTLIALSKDFNHFTIDNLNAIAVATLNKDSVDLYRFTNRLNDENATDDYSKVTALSFIDNSRVYSLQNNGKIFEWNIGKAKQKAEISSLQGINNISIAEFSPDGNQIITLSKRDGAMKVWSIAELKKGKNIPLFIDSNARNKYIKQIIFSSDSKQIIKLSSKGNSEVWSVENQKRIAGFDNNSDTGNYNITAANFSPDGQYILEATSDGYINTFDNKGKHLNNLDILYEIENIGFRFSSINNISLSPDWRKLILLQEGGEVVVVSRVGNDSVITIAPNISEKPATPLILKKLNGSSGNIKQALFIDNNRIVTIHNNGFINLWNTKLNFNNLDEAFLSTKKFTELNFSEKIAQGQMTDSEILSESNNSNLRSAALYYNDKLLFSDDSKQIEKYAEIALKIYRKLVLLDTGTLKNDDLLQIINITRDLNRSEELKTKPDYTLVVERYKEILFIYQNQLKNQLDETTSKNAQAKIYWNLSFRQLFVKDFIGAIASSKMGIALDSNIDGINTNLALGYLLSNQYDSAEFIYKKYAGKKFSSDERMFTEEFLGDFKALETAYIILPDDERVKKIRKILEQK